MKSDSPFSPNTSLGDYVLQYGLREPAVMRALREEMQTHRCGNMQTAPAQALLLQFIAQLIQAKRYLEIGVFTGYSTLAVALGLPADGQIIACDISAEFTNIALHYWQQANVANKIQLILQPARQTLSELIHGAPFDLIYIDADKANYIQYYEQAIRLLRAGGVMALDNMLSKGRVTESMQSYTVQTIHRLNQMIQQDSRVEMVMLPVGDGLTLLRKK